MPSVSPDAETAPDPIDPEALRHIHLLDDEHVERVWKTVRGFLLMTNLRCTEVSHWPQLFGKTEWVAGPNLFFYNLAPPRVLFRHILQLSEEHERNGFTVRFLLHDPYSVAEEVEAARAPGRREWLRRRAQSEARYRASRMRWESGNRVIFHDANKEVVKVRCRFCSGLMDVSAGRCPFCGAPQA